MPPESIDPALNIFGLGTILLSIVACMNVIHMSRNGPVLPYESRRPVPWGPVGCVLAMTFLLMTAISAFGGDRGDSAGPQTSSALVIAMLAESLIVGAFAFAIATFAKATPRDLGLPANSKQWIRDVCIGAAACLAALAPVLILQVALMQLFFSNQASGHPLIKMLTDAPPAPSVFFLSAVFTVVVAPICEEITFRLLLQGWLERWEDEQLEWRKNATRELVIEQANSAENNVAVTSDHPDRSNASSLLADELTSESERPRRGIAGLPYGWFPIMVSATAFGLAHFGYGPEPIPLFLLAVVIGYLYQRTHSIIPGIVTHALFNLFSMIILWRMLYHHG